MAYAPEVRALRSHQEWIGYLQPVGLVVSGPALLAVGAHVNRNILREQEQLRAMVGEPQVIADFKAFARELLGWQTEDLVEAPDGLSVVLTEYHETLRPTFAVIDPEKKGTWTLLVQVLPAGTDLDATPGSEYEGWGASPQVRFERVLRETNNPVGLICNGNSLRLIYAPRGETSGHVTFPVAAMCETAGRPILGAVLMLFGADRLFNVPAEQRLAAILKESRKYQNEVSTRLAEQVLTALHELLRGFQAADEAAKGKLLGELRRGEGRQEIYGGLLTTLMRLVFVLYAEDRGLMPASEVFVKHYSITALSQRLRDDAARFPDTMDQRYGAWAQLLTLFRFVFDGGSHGALHVPARHGQLFNPDAYPFLEGRPRGVHRSLGQKLTPPRVSDGTIHRVLENLLVLDGERLSYRALDVEQIGSVYEAMMGFELEEATGPSIAVRPHHVVVNLRELLEKTGKGRLDEFEETTGCELATAAAKSFQAAKKVEELIAALDKRVSQQTPGLLPAGSLYLQPGQERRRSGSHYTPRSLTEPIVRTTLEPVIAALGDNPTPEQILDLKVCDPAMGSGAFLVEACRFLGDALKGAWERHKKTPKVPPDEDLILHGRRLVAQRCLYGVDKNPFAVSLAKLSLWLVTLAKDHPFTFLDHALRCGDSLVGLSNEEISQFNWTSSNQLPVISAVLGKAVTEAISLRAEIKHLAEYDDFDKQGLLLKRADEALESLHLVGDCVVACFFAETRPKEREQALHQWETKVHAWLSGRSGSRGVSEFVNATLHSRSARCFHWQLEFPEVFAGTGPGFDAVIGNPPFAGVVTLAQSSAPAYTEWLRMSQSGSGGKTDLVAFFFRRIHSLLRRGGFAGLLATKTVAQGDTRRSGLGKIVQEGGVIFRAVRRIKWPGAASVVVSAIHFCRGETNAARALDGKSVQQINSYLLPSAANSEPSKLFSASDLAFLGVKPGSRAFVFEDSNSTIQGTEELNAFLQQHPGEKAAISPYFGGAELYGAQADTPTKWVWRLGLMSEPEAKRFPAAMAELRATLQRLGHPLEGEWWQFARSAKKLFEVINTRGLKKVLVRAEVSDTHAMVFRSTRDIYSNKAILFALDSMAAFALLQSSVHEYWSRMTSSTMKNDLSYVPGDSFETFPHPLGDWSQPLSAIADPAKTYYSFRESMGGGLTAIYSRFHDPDDRTEPTVRLRHLRNVLDCAVLDAYGWNDIKPRWDFARDARDERGDDGEPMQASERSGGSWRYCWDDESRDEVLSRLLELNEKQAKADQLRGVPSQSGRQEHKVRRRKDSRTRDMF